MLYRHTDGPLLEGVVLVQRRDPVNETITIHRSSNGTAHTERREELSSITQASDIELRGALIVSSQPGAAMAAPLVMPASIAEVVAVVLHKSARKRPSAPGVKVGLRVNLLVCQCAARVGQGGERELFAFFTCSVRLSTTTQRQRLARISESQLASNTIEY